MKKVNLYLGALAALATCALIGCQKDDGGSDKITSEMATSFANISIVMPGHANSRAEGDEGRSSTIYDNGTADENKIGELLLMFYDAQGNVVGSSTTTSTTATTGTTTGTPIEAFFTNTVLITMKEGANVPVSVVAYVNPANTTSQNDRLEQIRNLIRTSDQIKNDKGFLMNNSGHYENGIYTIAAKLNSNFIYTSEDKAKKALQDNGDAIAAKIYVERVAAKVKVAMNPDLTIEPYTVGTDTRTNYSLRFVPESWALTATAKNTLLIKNMNTTINSLNTALNGNTSWAIPTDAAYRTFWARSYGYGIPNEVPQPQDGIIIPVTGKDNDPNYLLNYVSYNSNEFKSLEKDGAYITMANTEAVYIPENTMRGGRFVDLENFPNPYASVTSAVIKGHYEVTGDNENKFADGFYLRQYSEGTGEGTLVTKYGIYTESEVIKAMLHGQAVLRVNADNAEGVENIIKLTHNDKTYDIKGQKVPNAANHYTIQIDPQKINNTHIFRPTNNNDGSVTWTEVAEADKNKAIGEINEELDKFAGQALYYNGGKAFFYVPIKHNGTGTDAFIDQPNTGDYGIVRNHSYQVTINSIKGLATGIADDNDKPLPDPTPTQAYFINASMNILSWHIMGQTVDL